MNDPALKTAYDSGVSAAFAKHAVSPAWIRRMVSSSKNTVPRLQDFYGKMDFMRSSPRMPDLTGKHWGDVDQAAEDALAALLQRGVAP